MPANLENEAVATGLENISFIPIPKKGNAKECSNYHAIALTSQASKVMTNLDNILKSRDITLPIKVHLVKSMIFPVVIYGCESWTLKKAEYRRINAFELWCWGDTLESPLDCKEIQPVHPKGNQS